MKFILSIFCTFLEKIRPLFFSSPPNSVERPNNVSGVNATTLAQFRNIWNKEYVCLYEKIRLVTRQYNKTKDMKEIVIFFLKNPTLDYEVSKLEIKLTKLE